MTNAATRMGVEQCDHPLSRDRKCCHVKGHDSQHSHTWQQGDARYQHVGNYLIDMETGEVVGDAGDVNFTEFKPSAPRRVLELYRWSTEPRAAIPIAPDYHGGPEPYWCPHPTWEPAIGAMVHDMWRCEKCNYGYWSTEGLMDLPGGFQWHYRTPSFAVGVDSDGHDVSLDRATGKLTRIYSVNDRKEAVGLARTLGPTKASRKLDIPVNSIKSWRARGIG